MNILPILNSDSYKQFHQIMYPNNLTFLYSNMTPRKSRLPGVDHAVWVGLQYYIKEYLISQWGELFFQKPWGEIEAEYKRFHKHFSGVDMKIDHWKELHELGYLPLQIKALPEGTLVPMRVPFFTIQNTDDRFPWLVNFLETQMSTVMWSQVVVATIAHQYRKEFDRAALETTGSTEGVQWQGHDFSMRGISSIESCFNQFGHLLSFTGTDTIPAVLFAEKYYRADIEKELVGSSVPATEHSVMMCRGQEGEIDTFKDLLSKFSSGILSIVSDTWNLWTVLTEYLPALKDEILARDGKIVVRPDSGDPVDIICGVDGSHYHDAWRETMLSNHTEVERKGVVELLWDIFGGTINEQGYKVLDPHIGCIYGDAITLERAKEINERLKAKGFASINWVAGIGSFTYNHNTRDTLGMAIKATACILEQEDGGHALKEIFKDPITDSGEKKSAKGLLYVERNSEGVLELHDQCNIEEEEEGLLETVFLDGAIMREQSLTNIRKTLENDPQNK